MKELYFKINADQANAVNCVLIDYLQDEDNTDDAKFLIIFKVRNNLQAWPNEHNCHGNDKREDKTQ